MKNFDHLPHFFTTSIKGFIPIFEMYPQAIGLVLDCLDFLHENNRCEINAFVIMKDHFHVVWTPKPPQTGQSLRKSFKTKLGMDIVNFLSKTDPEFLAQNFTSLATNRRHRIWKTASGNLPLQHPGIRDQKIRYIHKNPITGNYATVDNAIDYPWSSARSYAMQQSNFSFLTVLPDVIPWQ